MARIGLNWYKWSTERIKLGQPSFETFGGRVRRLRRAAGFSSREEYAAAINNPAVSAAVIKNIEAGRKADISVIHLFELAYPLNVSPLVLLLDFARPNQPARIVGLGPNFEGSTNREIDEWISEPAAYAPVVFAKDDYRERLTEVHQMFVAREYRVALWSAETTVRNVRESAHDYQEDRRFYGELTDEEQDEKRKRNWFLRKSSTESDEIRRLIELRAKELGVDVSGDSGIEWAP